MILDALDAALAGSGLVTRGAFHPGPADRLPTPQSAGTLVLIGNVGGAMWSAFSATCDAARRATLPHPLDVWTRAVIDPVALAFDAEPLYPFQGPPFQPFQRWARRALPVHQSPIGPLIDAEAGLWHALRAALVLPRRLPVPPPAARPSPCDACTDRPCLSGCPVDAIGHDRYDVAACVRHVTTPAGGACRDAGCRARAACPVGSSFAYPPDQRRFHMEKFLEAHGG